MKVKSHYKFLKIFGLSMLLAFGLPACSGSDQQEDQEDLEASEDQNSAEADDQDGQENDEEENFENGDENNLGQNENDLGQNDLGQNDLGQNDLGQNDLGQNDLGQNNLGQNNSLNAAVEPQGNIVNSAANNTMAAPAPMPSGDGSRVVRFITENGTPVHSSPDGGSGAVSTMNQGDPVMVTMQGGWGMVAEGRFIPAGNLSEQIVPRARSFNGWN